MAEPRVDSIVQQVLKECQEVFTKGGVTACKEFLQKKADEWKTVSLNIGIIGNSGAGKSSFINKIRGLNAEDTDKGAAPVGVNETTKIPTPYSHPKNDKLQLWDLPGVGTPNFPREKYLEIIGFEKFDFFLIMSKSRFTENDQWIACAIAGVNKKFFFVRTNIYTDIKNNKRDFPQAHNPAKVLASIRHNIRAELGGMCRKKEMFLIDNHKRNLYDFNRLEEAIAKICHQLKKKLLCCRSAHLAKKW